MASQLDEEKTDYAQYMEQHQTHEKNIDTFTNQKEGLGKERDNLDKELDGFAGEGDRQAYDDKMQEREAVSANYDKVDKDLTAEQGELAQLQQDNPEHAAQYGAERKESELSGLDKQEFEGVSERLQEANIHIQTHGDVEQSPTNPEVGYNSQTPDIDSKQPDAFGDKEQDYLNQSGIEGQGTNYQTQSADNNLSAEQGEDMLADFGNEAPEQGGQGVGERSAPANDNYDMLAEYGGDETPEQGESVNENEAIEYQNASENLMEEYENEESMQAANDNEQEQER